MITPDDITRCAICGWPLMVLSRDGCHRGGCSIRPFPDHFYSPTRAQQEYAPWLNDDARCYTLWDEPTDWVDTPKPIRWWLGWAMLVGGIVGLAWMMLHT